MAKDKPQMMLRSPLLTEAPLSHTDWRGVLARLIKVLGGLIVLWMVLLSVHHRIWPEDGLIGQTLYRLHDQTYLPLKGYLFTANLPFSQVLWVAFALLLVILTISFISRMGIIRWLHFNILRRLISHPSKHVYVVKLAAWTRLLRGSAPYLSRATALQHWEEAVIHLSGSSPHTLPAKAFDNLLAYTELLSELHKYFRQNNEKLRFLEQLQFTDIFAQALIVPAEYDLVKSRLVTMWLQAYNKTSLDHLPQIFGLDVLAMLNLVFTEDGIGTHHLLKQECGKSLQRLLAYFSSTDDGEMLQSQDHQTLVILTRMTMNLNIHVAMLTEDYRLALTYWETIEMAQFTYDVTHDLTQKKNLHFLIDLLTENNIVLQQMCMRQVMKTTASQNIASYGWFQKLSEFGPLLLNFEHALIDFWAPEADGVPYTAQGNK